MLHIDFVSDINCPWCALGLAALDRAVESLGDAVPVEIRFQPFELNPQLPGGGVPLVDYLQQKYGMSAAQVAAVHEDIRARGTALGFRFGPREHIWNSFDAHRLLAWAAAEQPAGAQHRLKRALVQAYMGEGRNTGDATVLCDVVAHIGLDAAHAAQVLAGDEYAQEVRETEQQWQRAGIHAVPSVIVNGKHLLQGAQSPATYERVLRDLAQETAD